MDIQAYISSGILELYLSGQLASEEAQEVERMAEAYPEIRAELDDLEAAIGAFAEASYEARPSDALLGNIMGAIAEADATQVKQAPTPIVPLNEPAAKSSNWRWIAVAAAIALLISLVFNYQQYNQLQQTNDQLVQSNLKQERLASQFDRTSDILEVLASANSQIIDLEGRDLAPDSKARVYWNTESKKAYFRMQELAQLTEDQAYQLWAIIDGKPVDAGVLRADGSLELAKSFSGIASAFAVTIEPRGGSSEPTLDQMVLYGEA